MSGGSSAGSVNADRVAPDRVAPDRVAIIGGGCAAMATAFELTRPEHEGRFEVTIYQQGWRLGGKGASGRGPADRIEEHGLHIWLGFYENAFRLMRECYRELERDPQSCRISHWRDAFYPAPEVGVADRSSDGRWQTWLAHFPPAPGEPGDPTDVDNPFTTARYVVRTAELLRTLVQAVAAREQRARPTDDTPAQTTTTDAAAPDAAAGPETLADQVVRLLKLGPVLTAAALIEAIRLLETLLGAPARYPKDMLLGLVDRVASGLDRVVGAAVADDDEMRRMWEVIDLTLAVLRGLVRFGVLTSPRGLDVIDDYDCREWLKLNGASDRAVDSAIVRGLYDLALAYEDGDERRPGLAAGQAIRGAWRMFFTYRGSLFWRMRSGMGDVVFAPFYEVLRRRGVRFRFFHRLQNVRLAPDESLADGERPYVAALEFDVQAKVKGGGEYQPLKDVRGLPCWPSDPDWNQLVSGARLKREGRAFESHADQRKVGTDTLRVVDDFDFVVLAVGGGAVPHLCKELIAREPRWQAMAASLHTVATQALQIWLRPDMAALGWKGPPVTMSGFEKPFDTWADMSDLATEESWAETPGAIAYFCGVLPTPPGEGSLDPHAERARVRQNALDHLNRSIGQLWPGAVRPGGGFRWEILADPSSRAKPTTPEDADESRLDGQFWSANVSPTDRYVLALPGTLKHRLSPLDNTFDNLTVAGDWTACGFTEGCVESAVMSGRLAAHALSGLPKLEHIVGYDHP